MSSTIIYNFLKTQGILRKVPGAYQTHSLRTTDGHEMNIQVKTHNQYVALYGLLYDNRDLLIRCNPGKNMPKKLFIDIDGYKPNKDIILNEQQSMFIQILFMTYASNIYGATDFIIMDKADCIGNIHITANAVVEDSYHERYIINKIRKLLLSLMGKESNMSLLDSDLYSKYVDHFNNNELALMVAATDLAPGIRSIYSSNGKDFYKIFAKKGPPTDRHEFIAHCLNADPSCIGNIKPGVMDLLDQNEFNSFKNTIISRAANIITFENNINRDFERLPTNAVIKLINKIPTLFIKSFYSFKVVLTQIKEQCDENNYDKIMGVFDHICQNDYVGYDAVNNAKMYKDAPVEIGGFDKLAKRITDFINGKLSPAIRVLRKNNRAIAAPYKDEIIENHNIEVINTKYIDIDFNEFGKTTAIMSATGTGKTSNMLKFIRANPKANILYIGCRISLLQSLKMCHIIDGDENSELMFNYYSDVNWTTFKKGRLLIQMESISKLSQKVINSFDYVIMDEYIALLEQIKSPNYINPRLAIDSLLNIFQSEAKLVLMDGYINKKYIDILDIVRPCNEFPLKIIKNTFQNKCDEKIIMMSSMDYMKEEIQKSVDNGKRFVFASDSIKKCKLVSQLIIKKRPLSKILMINGENSGLADIKNILLNINREIVKYDYFIYSPSISAGIDVDVTHFDLQFNCFTTSNSSINQCLQQINRVRNKADLINYVYLNKPYQKPLTAADYIAQFESKAFVVESQSLLSCCIIPDIGKSYILQNHPILKVITECNILKNADNNDANMTFIQKVKGQGYDVLSYFPLTNIYSPVTDSAINVEIKARESEQIAASVAINWDKLDVVNQQQKNESHKYAIKQTYKISENIINADFVDKFGSYKRMEKYKLLNKLLSGSLQISEDNDVVNRQWSNILSNRVIDNQRKIGSVLLNGIFINGLDDIKSGNKTFTKKEIIESISKITLPSLAHLSGMFGNPLKTKASCLSSLIKINWRPAILLINKILERLYDIKLAATNNHRTHYKIIYNGYISNG